MKTRAVRSMPWTLGALTFCGLVIAGSAHAVSNGPGIREQVRSAEALVERGEYYQALSRLQYAIAHGEPDQVPAQADFLLGEANAGVGNYADAIAHYEKYVSKNPDGEHAAKARAQLARLQEALRVRDDSEARIRELRAQVKADAGAEDARLELATLLWKAEDYDRATKHYVYLIESNPDLAQHPDVRDRIEWQPGREPVALTPSEMVRREIAARPLVVVNTSSFARGRDRRTQKARDYVVTGEVHNRSREIYSSVEVQVTLYNFGTTIIDTKSMRVGRVEPGASRAFSVRFNGLDEVNNIDRYECTVQYR